mgnify:CR=1 FL=1
MIGIIGGSAIDEINQILQDWQDAYSSLAYGPASRDPELHKAASALGDAQNYSLRAQPGQGQAAIERDGE